MNNEITIAEVISLTDSLKPNTRTPEEKKLWLSNLDKMVFEDIVSTHEDAEITSFTGYTENTDDDTALLIPAHYGADIYRFYLEMQIDLANAEYNKYNASSALFQSAYANYELSYHHRHMPLQAQPPAWGGNVNAV